LATVDLDTLLDWLRRDAGGAWIRPVLAMSGQ
jgi:hypothetical protein